LTDPFDGFADFGPNPLLSRQNLLLKTGKKCLLMLRQPFDKVIPDPYPIAA